MTVPPPPTLESLAAGYQLVAGLGLATILPDGDFETYSEAGWVWDHDAAKWVKPPGTPPSKKGGLFTCGAAVYAQHPTTEVLSFKYDLKEGRGRRHWKPGDPNPQDLFDHIARGGLFEAWNVAFEWWIWNFVCVPKYGWPPLPAEQCRCAMAKARAHALPGALDDAGSVAGIEHQKDPGGARLLDKFSRPRNPTKTDPRRRIRPEEDPTDAARLYAYNERDIQAEAEMSALTPDLIPDELAFWQVDQVINRRGVALDVASITSAIAVIEQAFAKYNAELSALTGGIVREASQLPALKAWLGTRGLVLYQLREEDLDELLKRKDLPADVYRVLQIRSLIGSASIKKLYAMRNQLTAAGRVHDLFNFHAARTGRVTGADIQATNLPRNGPSIFGPSDTPGAFNCCSRWFGAHRYNCPWCGVIWPPTAKPQEWNPKVFDDAFEVLATRSLECVEMFFGDACAFVVGCLRALFVAGDGHELIASDYSAIEAVVLAALAGEQWRLDVFANKIEIYIASISRITGISVEVYQQYRKDNKKHHPDRQKGKVLELALGYGGWLGAMLAFGADEFFTEEEIVAAVKAWRAASPAIVEFWGGQHRGMPWNPDYRAEYYGLEGAAVQAILNPGTPFNYKAPHPLSPAITYVMRGRTLYCILPSGRPLTYHNARLTLATRGPHKGQAQAIVFEGWNTNPKAGPYGWVTMETYGPKLTENVVQAVSRDILREGIMLAEARGYPVVLHVYDEIVAEVPKGFGTVEELESIMDAMPAWARGWPVRAAGGWRGHRYRKD